MELQAVAIYKLKRTSIFDDTAALDGFYTDAASILDQIKDALATATAGQPANLDSVNEDAVGLSKHPTSCTYTLDSARQYSTVADGHSMML